MTSYSKMSFDRLEGGGEGCAHKVVFNYIWYANFWYKINIYQKQYFFISRWLHQGIHRGLQTGCYRLALPASMCSPLSSPQPEREREGSSCDLGGESSREGSCSICPFVQWCPFPAKCPLEGGCTGDALGQQLVAAPGLRACPSAPPRRWEISLPCQTAQLSCSKCAFPTAPRLQAFICTASSTFRAFMAFFFSSFFYAWINQHFKNASCYKLKAPNISSCFWQFGTFLSLQMYTLAHIFFSIHWIRLLLLHTMGFNKLEPSIAVSYSWSNISSNCSSHCKAYSSPRQLPSDLVQSSSSWLPWPRLSIKS